MTAPTDHDTSGQISPEPHASAVQALHDRNQQLEEQLKQVLAENRRLRRQWHEATSSLSWRLVNRLSRLFARLAPCGSWRRRCLKAIWRNLMVGRRYGPFGWALRSARQAKSKAINTLRVYQARLMKFEPDARPVMLALSHIGGGGTERHIRDMVAELSKHGVRSIYGRPDSHGYLLFEERNPDWSLRWQKRIKPRQNEIQQLLANIQPGLVHVHHSMNLPQALFDVIDQAGLPTDWTLHDYHSICPRIHLHDARGHYCGEPDTTACNTCLKKLGDYHGLAVKQPITSYRADWHTRLSTARRIYVPSLDVKNRLLHYFPDLEFIVRPHTEPSRPEAALAQRWSPDEPVRVAVIGTIGPIKGSMELLAAAQDAAERNLPLEFVLVGTSNLEPQLLATGCVQVTGPYHENEIWNRLEEAQCHLAWLPSVWPETYMYTLSIAQLAGFFPIVYNIGAQSQRVHESGYGLSLPLDADPRSINDLFLQKTAQLARQPNAVVPRFAEYPDFLNDYYGLSIDQLRQQASATGHTTNAASREINITPHKSRSDNARFHKHHRQLSA